MWIEIRYVGGPEGQWVVRARGADWKVCGHLSAADVFASLSAAVLVPDNGAAVQARR